jgi:hypothetical protein
MAANGASIQLVTRINLFISPGHIIDTDKFLYLKADYGRMVIK